MMLKRRFIVNSRLVFPMNIAFVLNQLYPSLRKRVPVCQTFIMYAIDFSIIPASRMLSLAMNLIYKTYINFLKIEGCWYGRTSLAQTPNVRKNLAIKCQYYKGKYFGTATRPSPVTELFCFSVELHMKNTVQIVSTIHEIIIANDDSDLGRLKHLVYGVRIAVIEIQNCRETLFLLW